MHVRHANQKPSLICRKGYLHLLILFIKEYAHENNKRRAFSVRVVQLCRVTQDDESSISLEPVNTALLQPGSHGNLMTYCCRRRSVWPLSVVVILNLRSFCGRYAGTVNRGSATAS